MRLKYQLLWPMDCQVRWIKIVLLRQQQIIIHSMPMKSHERILELHSLLSKLLDSLCFELSVNKNDENCLSLLQIMQWRKKGDIDQAEFIELYKSWLESKSVFDLFSAKQVQIFPKHELIASELVQNSFMNVAQVNKTLETLNDLYNKLYLQHKPSNLALLSSTQRIFSFLDPEGFIHLRLSSIFFLAGAIMVSQRYSIPINYEAYRVYFNDIRKQLSEINGIVSLRGFKNFIISLSPAKRTNFFDHIMPILAEISANELPNLMQEAFSKWKNFPRFTSSESRKNWEIYKRVFEENERIFYDEGATVEYFLNKYGEQFIQCFDIDNNLLREFNILLKDCLNKYIQIFIRISHSYGVKQPQQQRANHKKKQVSQLHHPKMSQRQSFKEKTPTKSSSKKIQFRNRTPTKRVEKIFQSQLQIRREFGSADKSKTKSYARQTTPTKSHRGPGGLYLSQANTGQKTTIKNGIQKDSFYNKMHFFKNKRVESYEIVMKRLKGK